MIKKTDLGVAVFVLMVIVVSGCVGTGPAQGLPTTTTAPPTKIESPTEAGKAISNISSAAVGIGSILADIDNNIG